MPDMDFGRSVAISGARVAVGAEEDTIAGVVAGSAYIYDLMSSTPGVPIAILNNPNPAAGDQFGQSVAIEGATLVVGATRADSQIPAPGVAYVFGVGPRLRVGRGASGFATISWVPTGLTEFVLQYSDGLAPTNWLNAASGMENPTTVPLTDQPRFYRLLAP
jgi:hypothetical protein